MNDITLLFITAGQLPKRWAEFHLKQLQDYPMIILRDDKKMGYEQIYRKMLEGAKLATTDYVAVIEDDVLYSKEHFEYRPPLDTFAYNQHRWALFTWGKPIYSIRNRKSNCSLIAPRNLLIEALEERFAKYPTGMPPEFTGELGRERVEKGLGVTPRKSTEWYSEIGLVQINHKDATEDRQKRQRKTLGPIKAFDIPRWGKAEDLLTMLWTSA